MNRTPRTRKGAALAGAGLLALISATGCAADQSAANDDPAGVDTAPAATTADATESASPSAEPDLVTTFSDTFDDDANGGRCRLDRRAPPTVAGGDFVWESKQPVLRPHILAGDAWAMAFDAGRLEMTDVRVTATVTPKRGARRSALFCREVPDSDADFQWYEFVVRDGYSAIRLADVAGNLEPIEEGDAVVPTARSQARGHLRRRRRGGSAALVAQRRGAAAGERAGTARQRRVRSAGL